jgi:CBS-domain-containing membrane protein
MPSMHVAWAMLIGIGTVSVSRSRWRWIGAAHALFTVLAVTLTGYHWLLDGIVATAVLLVGMAIAVWWNRRRSRTVDEPLLELADQLADAT